MTVPRIVHRIWLDEGPDDQPMPEEFVGYGDDWRRLHPGWDVIDWLSTGALPKLHNRRLFDDARELVPHDWKRFRSDLLRLELLWWYGGVYADADVQPLRNIGPMLTDGHVVVGRSPNQPCVTNAIIAAPPRHPYIKACIDRAEADVVIYTNSHRPNPLHKIVGPWLLQRALDSRNWATVEVLPSEMLYPQPIADRDAPVGVAYTTHRWANTRDNRKGGVR